jgi:two-component system, sensor histidine kinase and response regulator
MTKILVMEDEWYLREEIMEVLQLEGFEVAGVPNGRLGVTAAREHLPDLIICDIMMPELDGYGVLLELRSDSLTSTIPFIFLTAKAERDDLRYGMALGADDYITKPFTHDELMSAIQSRLERHQAIHDQYAAKMDELRRAIVLSLPHELRTPLTTIMGYAELLLMDKDVAGPDQIERIAEAIIKGSARLHRQIENYLLYAQLEIIKLDPEWVINLEENILANPGDVIADTALQQARSYQRNGDLVLDTHNTDVRVTYDNLKKIALELVDNALKFSDTSTPVHISTQTQDDAYILTITDQGRGMSPEQIKQAGAYMQFDRKLYEQQGSGLGLSLARRLVDIHAGTLHINSEPEHGTHVAVSLRVG